MKSKAGFVLCLIGGVLDIIIGFILAVFAILLILISSNVVSSGKLASFSMTMTLLFVFISLIFIVLGILGIIFSIKINKDEEVRKGSIGCWIFGILTLNILLIIGSILGLVASKKDIQASSYNVAPLN